MRLLDVETGQFVERDPENTVYAILSHTWSFEGEQTYQELRKIQQRYPPKKYDPLQPTSPSHPPPVVLSSGAEPYYGSVAMPLLSQPWSNPSGSVTAIPISNERAPLLQPADRSLLTKQGVSSGRKGHAAKCLPRAAPNHPRKRPRVRLSSSPGPQDHHESSAVTPPSQPSPNPSVSVTTSVAPVSTPTECTPLLQVADRPSVMEQGIPPENHHKNSRFRQLQLHVVHWLKWIWGFLVPLFAFVLPWRFIESLGFHRRTSSLPALSPSRTGIHVSPNPPVPDSPLSDPPEPSMEAHSEMPPHSIWADPELSPKIREACAVARANGFRFIWIDSCCIDKSSSSELSEAINSMYYWYGQAMICYAYLADVPPGEEHERQGSHFRTSRWFMRGWTLQELIAPGNVTILAQDWTVIGTKHTLADLVEDITNINYKALLRLEPLDTFSIAQRLSWASWRETTRVEDKAYSLLGIFDINMPTLYGEGEGAFRRLQEEIIRRVPDQSLLAWGNLYLPVGSQTFPEFDPTTMEQDSQDFTFGTYVDHRQTLFAPSPNSFANSARSINAASRDTLRRVHLSRCHAIEYTPSPYGICTQFQMLPTSTFLPPAPGDKSTVPEQRRLQWYLVILGCEHEKYPGLLLARVCCTAPSDAELGVEFLHRGGVMRPFELVLLSPATIQRYRAQIKLKTIYISHPYHTKHLSQDTHLQPQNTINLVLLRETRDALRARGYEANLRGPDPAHPTTHWLTLSHEDHVVDVEYQQTFQGGGRRFTVDGHVKMSPMHDASAKNQPLLPIRTMSWTDCVPWLKMPGKENVIFGDKTGTKMIVMSFVLELVAIGHYVLHVEVVAESSEPASSPSVAQPLQEEGRPMASTDANGGVPGDSDAREGGGEGIGGGERIGVDGHPGIADVEGKTGRAAEEDVGRDARSHREC
ncbi:hypothetical protein LXA43DRAFT_1185299 [Ganoderma leucocontextum]|nr:hypothetical protein LXA43DRAFT_1185299 [Ganoderma leucocontextum]